MKINVLKTKINAKNNLVAVTKNIKLSIPEKNIRLFGKTWAELHRKTFIEIYKKFPNLVKEKLIYHGYIVYFINGNALSHTLCDGVYSFVVNLFYLLDESLPIHFRKVGKL